MQGERKIAASFQGNDRLCGKGFRLAYTAAAFYGDFLQALKAVFKGLAVEGNDEAADFIELLLNVQTPGDHAVAEIPLIVGLGDLMVSVRLGIKPALDVTQDERKGGCIFPCEEHSVSDLDVGKAAVRVDDISAPAGDGDELCIVFRCGKHSLLLNVQT